MNRFPSGFHHRSISVLALNLRCTSLVWFVNRILKNRVPPCCRQTHNLKATYACQIKSFRVFIFPSSGSLQHSTVILHVPFLRLPRVLPTYATDCRVPQFPDLEPAVPPARVCPRRSSRCDIIRERATQVCTNRLRLSKFVVSCVRPQVPTFAKVLLAAIGHGLPTALFCIDINTHNLQNS